MEHLNKESVQREKQHRFSIRKFNVGVASVAIAAFWMVSGQAVAATEVTTETSPEVVVVASSEETGQEADEEPAQPVAEPAVAEVIATPAETPANPEAEEPVADETSDATSDEAEEVSSETDAEQAKAETEPVDEEAKPATDEEKTDSAAKKDEAKADKTAESKSEASSAIAPEQESKATAEKVVTRVVATTYRVQYINEETGAVEKQRNYSVTGETTNAVDEPATLSVEVDLDVPAGFVAVSASNKAGQEFAIVNNAIAAAVVEKDSSSRSLIVTVRKDEVSAGDNAPEEEGYTALRKVADDYSAPVVPYNYDTNNDVTRDEKWIVEPDGSLTVRGGQTNKASDASIKETEEVSAIYQRLPHGTGATYKDTGIEIEVAGYEADPTAGRTTLLIAALGDEYDTKAGLSNKDAVGKISDDYNERNNIDYYITVAIDENVETNKTAYIRLVNRRTNESFKSEEIQLNLDSSERLTFKELDRIQQLATEKNSNWQNASGYAPGYNLNYVIRSIASPGGEYTVNIQPTVMQGFWHDGREGEEGRNYYFRYLDTNVGSNNENLYIYNHLEPTRQGDAVNAINVTLPHEAFQSTRHYLVDLDRYIEYLDNHRSYDDQRTGEETLLAQYRTFGEAYNIYKFGSPLDFETFEFVEGPEQNETLIDELLIGPYKIGERRQSSSGANGIKRIETLVKDTGEVAFEIWVLDIRKPTWYENYPERYKVTLDEAKYKAEGYTTEQIVELQAKYDKLYEDEVKRVASITDPEALRAAGFSLVFANGASPALPAEYYYEYDASEYVESGGQYNTKIGVFDFLTPARNDNNYRLNDNPLYDPSVLTTELLPYQDDLDNAANTMIYMGRYQGDQGDIVKNSILNHQVTIDGVKSGFTYDNVNNGRYGTVQKGKTSSDTGAYRVPILVAASNKVEFGKLNAPDTVRSDYNAYYRELWKNSLDNMPKENLVIENGEIVGVTNVRIGGTTLQMQNSNVYQDTTANYYYVEKGHVVVRYYEVDKETGQVTQRLSGTTTGIAKAEVGEEEVHTKHGNNKDDYDTTNLRPKTITMDGKTYRLVKDVANFDKHAYTDGVISNGLGEVNPTYTRTVASDDADADGLHTGIKDQEFQQTVSLAREGAETGDKVESLFTQVVNYYYVLDEEETGDVVVRYYAVDENGENPTPISGTTEESFVNPNSKDDEVKNKVAHEEKDTTDGEDGASYNTADDLKPDYITDGDKVYKRIDLNGTNPKLGDDKKGYTDGVLTENDPADTYVSGEETGDTVAVNKIKVVNYYYEEVKGDVVVRYYAVDEAGNVIEAISGKTEDSFTNPNSKDSTVKTEEIDTKDASNKKGYNTTDLKPDYIYVIKTVDDKEVVETYKRIDIDKTNGRFNKGLTETDGNLAIETATQVALTADGKRLENGQPIETDAAKTYVSGQETGDKDGVVAEKTKVVNYYYEKVTGDVIVRYYSVDKDGNPLEIIKDEVVDTKEADGGKDYDTTDHRLERITHGDKTYQLVSIAKTNPHVETDGELTNGTISVNNPANAIEGKETGDTVTAEKTKVVNYYYEEIVTKDFNDKIFGNVVVHYVDKDGNPLQDDYADTTKELVATKTGTGQRTISDGKVAEVDPTDSTKVKRDAENKVVFVKDQDPVVTPTNATYNTKEEAREDKPNEKEQPATLVEDGVIYYLLTGNDEMRIDADGKPVDKDGVKVVNGVKQLESTSGSDTDPKSDLINSDDFVKYTAETGSDKEAKIVEGTTHVTYVYAPGGDVVVRYYAVDKDGNVIEAIEGDVSGDSKVTDQDGNAKTAVSGQEQDTAPYSEPGKTYETTDLKPDYIKTEDGRTFKRIDLDGTNARMTNGRTETDGDLAITTKDGTTLTADGKRLENGQPIESDAAKTYVSGQETGDTKGVVAETTKLVNYYYEKVTGDVEVRYFAVDKNGEVINFGTDDFLKDKQTVVETGNGGDSYTTATDEFKPEIIEKNGKKYQLVSLAKTNPFYTTNDNSDNTGKLSEVGYTDDVAKFGEGAETGDKIEVEKTQVVNYYYEEIVEAKTEVKGNVVVHYVDKAGNELQADYTDSSDELVATITSTKTISGGTAYDKDGKVITDVITKTGVSYNTLEDARKDKADEKEQPATLPVVVNGETVTYYLLEGNDSMDNGTAVVNGVKQVETTEGKDDNEKDAIINSDEFVKHTSITDGDTAKVVQGTTHVTYVYQPGGDVVVRYYAVDEAGNVLKAIEGAVSGDNKVADQNGEPKTSVSHQEQDTPKNTKPGTAYNTFDDLRPSYIETADGKLYKLVADRTDGNLIVTDKDGKELANDSQDTFVSGDGTEKGGTVTAGKTTLVNYYYKEVTGDALVRYYAVDAAGNVIKEIGEQVLDTKVASNKVAYDTTDGELRDGETVTALTNNETTKPDYIKDGEETYKRVDLTKDAEGKQVNPHAHTDGFVTNTDKDGQEIKVNNPDNAIEGAETGKKIEAEKTQIVNYYYELVTGDVYVHYFAVDENGKVIEFADGKPLADSKVDTKAGNIDQPYDTTDKVNPTGEDLKPDYISRPKTDENSDPVLDKDGKPIVETYKRVDLNGTNPHPVTDGDPEKGDQAKVAEEDKNVNYYYEKVTGNVVVRYFAVDKNGRVIESIKEQVPDTEKEDGGIAYDTTDHKPKTITVPVKDANGDQVLDADGEPVTKTYQLVSVAQKNPFYTLNGDNTGWLNEVGYTDDDTVLPGSETGDEDGVVVEKTKVVNYYYEEVVVTTTPTPVYGNVIIHYVDVDGNELAEDRLDTDKAKVATIYTTTTKTISGGDVLDKDGKVIEDKASRVDEVVPYNTLEEGEQPATIFNPKDGLTYFRLPDGQSKMTEKGGNFTVIDGVKIENRTEGVEKTDDFVKYTDVTDGEKALVVQGTTHVTYVYSPGGDVIVHYFAVDENNKVIKPLSGKSTGIELEEVQTTERDMPEFTDPDTPYVTTDLKPQTITDENGDVWYLVKDMTDGDPERGVVEGGKTKEINYYYKKPTTTVDKSEVRGNVIIHYVDKDGKPLLGDFADTTAELVSTTTVTRVVDPNGNILKETTLHVATGANYNTLEDGEQPATIKVGDVTYKLLEGIDAMTDGTAVIKGVKQEDETVTGSGDEAVKYSDFTHDTVIQGTTHVTYVYAPVYGDVVVKYFSVDPKGNVLEEIAEQVVDTKDGNIDNPYETTDHKPEYITKEGVTYKRVDLNGTNPHPVTDGDKEEGDVVKEGVKTVNYYYEKVTGDVYVHYFAVDKEGKVISFEDGSKLADDVIDTKDGNINDDYDTTDHKPEYITKDGVTYKRVDLNGTNPHAHTDGDKENGEDAKVAEQDKHVNYYYEKVTGNVYVHYFAVDKEGKVIAFEDGSKLADDVTDTKDGNINDDYDTTDHKPAYITKDGVTYKRVDLNGTNPHAHTDGDKENGAVAEQDKHINYYYEVVTGDVVVKYYSVDPKGNVLEEIAEQVVDTKDGNIDNPYETTDHKPEYITKDGVTYKRVDLNGTNPHPVTDGDKEEGDVVKEGVKTVNYYYEKVTGDVYVHYFAVDKDGKVIAFEDGSKLADDVTDTKDGNINDDYDTTDHKPAYITKDGVTYKRVDLNGTNPHAHTDGDKENGDVAEQDKHINYYYEVVTGDVVVKYYSVDPKGNVLEEIAEKVVDTKDGNIDNPYETTDHKPEYITKEGVTYKRVDLNGTNPHPVTDGDKEEGDVVKEGVKTVNYYYEKVTGDVYVHYFAVDKDGKVIAFEDGSKLADDVTDTKDGNINDDYDTTDHKPEYITKDGVTYKRVDLNGTNPHAHTDGDKENGAVAEQDKHINYYYEVVTGDVVVKYFSVDPKGNVLEEIAEQVVDTKDGNIDSPYETTDHKPEYITKEGVTYKRVDLNGTNPHPVTDGDKEDGDVVKEGVKTVNYYYEKVTGDVYVHYFAVDKDGKVIAFEDGSKLADDVTDTKDGNINDDYDTTDHKPEYITKDGVTYKRVDLNGTNPHAHTDGDKENGEDAKVAEQDKHVNYYYEKVTGDVYVHYFAVDKDGQVIAFEDGSKLADDVTDTKDGNINDNYDTTDHKPAYITKDGVTYKRVDLNGTNPHAHTDGDKENGDVAEQDKHINYYYEVVTGDVVVKYYSVDPKGNVLEEIAEKVVDTKDGNIDNPYETTDHKPEYITKEGVTYKRVDLNGTNPHPVTDGDKEEGDVVKEGVKTVNYYYEKVTGDVYVHYFAVDKDGKVIAFEDGSKLADDVTDTKDGNINDDYDTTDHKPAYITKDGVTYKRVDLNGTNPHAHTDGDKENGEVAEQDKHINYYYEVVTGDVVVKYYSVDPKGDVLEEIAEKVVDTKDGNIDNPYETTDHKPEYITKEGVTYKRVDLNGTNPHPVTDGDKEEGDVVKEGVKTVNYYYEKVTGDVYVHYFAVDKDGKVIAFEDGSKLADDVTDTKDGNINDDYDTTDHKPAYITKDGVTYKRVDLNGTNPHAHTNGDKENGAVAEQDKHINYYYEKIDSDVIVRYYAVDKDGRVVAEISDLVVDTKNGLIDSPYDTTDHKPEYITKDGVTYKRVDLNGTNPHPATDGDAETGDVVKDGIKTVNYYYEKVTGDVEVRYHIVDKDGNVIVENAINKVHLISDGNLGESYDSTTVLPTIIFVNGKTYRLVTVESNPHPYTDGDSETGEVVEGLKVIHYYYEEVVTSVIPTTIWVTVDGKVLRPIEDGTLPKDVFEGYEFVETVVDEDGNTTHIFKPVKPTATKPAQPKPAPKYVTKESPVLPNTGETDSSAVLTGLGMMFAAAGLVARRRRKED